MQGIHQVALAVLLRYASICHLYDGFLIVALEAEEEILLERSEEDVLSFLFLAV